MDQWREEEEQAEETRRRRKAQVRAALGGLAGVALVVAVVLAQGVIGDDRSDVEAADETASTAIRSVRNQAALEADAARAAGAAAMRTTTTTTAPPTTTTTAPPPSTTEAPPPPDPPVEEATPPADSGGAPPDPYSYATWDQLAECESGGNWAINTGNGYYGGLQFSLSSWQGVGGTGYPNEHSRETQIEMGIRLYESSGWGAWPACTASFGWR